jgi:hypothetical protein
MTPENRLRRVAILCCHFLRNLAFYRAGWRRGKTRRATQFWVTANGNFLDACILEWCKLFAGDTKSKHHWRRVITDQTTFYNNLLIAIGLTDAQFSSYREEMLRYRDKFVAHLDSEKIMHIPRLRLARKCVAYLYDYLLRIEDNRNVLHDAERSAARFYAVWVREGRYVYLEGEKSS